MTLKTWILQLFCDLLTIKIISSSSAVQIEKPGFAHLWPEGIEKRNLGLVQDPRWRSPGCSSEAVNQPKWFILVCSNWMCGGGDDVLSLSSNLCIPPQCDRPPARPPARSRCRVPRADDGRLTSAWECVCVCVCVASWSVATAPPQQTSCVISDLRHLPHAHTQNTHTRTRTRTQWRSVAERLLYLRRVLFFSTSFFSLFLSWKIFFTHSDKPIHTNLTPHMAHDSLCSLSS